MKFNLKLLCIFLIIIYILFIIYIIKYRKIEKFTNILELLNTSLEKNKKHVYPITSYEENNDKVVKSKNIINKDIKFIYLLKVKNYSYILYNKNLKKYMSIKIDYDNYINNILFKDLNKNTVGKFVSEKYNNIIIYLEFYKKNSNFEYFKNFKEIKFYLDDDDKYFYMKKDNNNNFIINLFNLFIGKITYNEDRKLYKIMCYEEYKTYLNIFGISLILLLSN